MSVLGFAAAGSAGKASLFTLEAGRVDEGRDGGLELDCIDGVEVETEGAVQGVRETCVLRLGAFDGVGNMGKGFVIAFVPEVVALEDVLETPHDACLETADLDD